MPTGRTVVITGANSGIGRAAALKFAEAGDQVVIACRNLDKGRKVQQEIASETGGNDPALMQVDMSSFESIRRFCSEFGQHYSKLDVLINNAGHFSHGAGEYQLSADKVELTFATNVFGPYLLTKLLRPFLAQSDDSRVLNASSTNIKHFFEPTRVIPFDSLTGVMRNGERYDSYRMYGDSKMALWMMTIRMAQELMEDHIKVNAVMISAFKMSKESVRKLRPYWRMLASLQNLFIPSPEIMGHQYFAICSREEFGATTGQLFNKDLVVTIPGAKNASPALQVKQLFSSNYYPSYADDEELVAKVWNLCGKITGA
ncbi:MAG TPA: short-chain dehydrogenase [Firmicutes bacterium]|nr:short-chain dehydrogenase [Bacillota bacterium]